MKHKTTAAAIRRNYCKNYILEVGYCNAQFLLCYENPTAYACGGDGWNFDLYEIGGIAICTGYRGMPAGKKFDYKLLRQYDKKARAVIEASKPDNVTWEKFDKQKRTKVKRLLTNFIKKVYAE